MTRKSPTQLSREHLEADGYHVEVVEQNIRTGKCVFKRDLWGWGDLLAIRRGEVLAVQTTSDANLSARVRKIEDSPLLPRVREAGIRIVVHGWKAMPAKVGAKAGEWRLREVDLS